MKTTRGSHDATGQDVKLDALLAHAPRYTPQEGFAERVLAAIHEEEEAAASLCTSLPRPWYLRPYSWGSAAAAACAVTCACLLGLLQDTPAITADTMAVDDTLLVEEALDCIDDPDLISAICSVSDGTYSIATGIGAY